LTYVLRHEAEKLNINIDTSGYVLIDDIISHPKFSKITFQ